MKNITIVGTGMGESSLTIAGQEAIMQSEVLIGASRLIQPYLGLGKEVFAAYAPAEVSRLIDEEEKSRFCILVSGDTSFYSAADSLCRKLESYPLTIIPGISSLSYFLSRLQRPWQDVAITSCHGREPNLVDLVRRNRQTFILTGNNISAISKALVQAGFGQLKTYLGENLGSDKEKISTLSVAALANGEISSLAVLLIENPDNDPRIRYGIPDEEFIRGTSPMTKAETRALTMSKLNLFPQAICCDIGAGTGSVAVEMALAAYEGQVFAIDKNPTAIKLIEANSHTFRVGNIRPVLGIAPAALENLPPLDIAFIGGSSRQLEGIFAALFKNNPKIRIVINAITFETLQDAIKAFSTYDLKPEIIQLGVGKTNPVGDLHMLKANSPVFIISGGGV